MPKVRVYEVAHAFGIEAKVVMAELHAMGEFVRSASSALEPAVVRRLTEALGRSPRLAVGRQEALSNVERPPGPPRRPMPFSERGPRPQASPRPRPHPQASPRLEPLGEWERELGAQEESHQDVGILQLERDILDAWERIMRRQPANRRSRIDWLVDVSELQRFQVSFAKSVRDWIAHPQKRRPGRSTLREALELMLEMERCLGT